jgi:adenylate kinase
MKTYFIGGAKGTGKSIIIEKFSNLTRLKVINTGNYFQGCRDLFLIKQRIIGDLIKNSPVIADTHYAGFLDGMYSGKFERGLYPKELETLSKGVNLELILVNLDVNLLIKRRKKDPKNTRDLDFQRALGELEYNKRYFEEYCNQLGVDGHIITNNNLNNSLNKLLERYRENESRK